MAQEGFKRNGGRSCRECIGNAHSARTSPITISGQALDRATLHIKKAKKEKINLGKAMVVGGLIYGLVNVRTDGNKILCATLDEKDDDWRIKTFYSRF